MTDPRSADDILANFLLTLRGEHEAIGERVVTAPRTPYYVLGTALSLELEGAESEAFAARQEAFPDTASDAGVLRHAEFGGVPRIAAARAVLRARVTGDPSTTLPIAAGKTLIDARGLVYLAPAGGVGFDGGGVGYIAVTARDAGAEQNLLAGDVLTWQNGAPLGFAATATVTAAPGDGSPLLGIGADEEGIEDLRARVVLFHKERANAGNRAAWVAALSEVEGVGSAFVWPRSRYTGSSVQQGVPGTLVAMVLAPPPGVDSYTQDGGGALGYGLRPSTTLRASADLRQRAVNYMEGRVDAQGRAVPEGLQRERHSASMNDLDYVMLDPSSPTTVNVVVTVILDPAVDSFPWGVNAGPPAYRTITSATDTSVTVDNVFEIGVDSRIAVFVGTAVIRGGWWLGVVTAVAGLVVTLADAFPAGVAATLGGNLVRPAPRLWGELRAIVLRYIDAMGPGDADPAGPAPIRSARFPRPADLRTDRVFTGRMIDVMQDLAGIAGVSSITVVDANTSAAVTAAVPYQQLLAGIVTITRG